ncbi:MAG TPA: DUF2207 domain-containing protein [Drouetiella sp.]
MKVFSLTIFVALYMVLGACPPALADIIQDFSSDIVIHEDSSVDITDSISIDFENNQRHGIYRHIPVNYDRHGFSYTLPLKVESVIGDSGKAENYIFSHQGNEVMIKIGDADRTVSGAHFYQIKYRVDRAFNFFGQAKAPEFYWNVTGDQWPYPIHHASATVHVPPAVKPEDIRVTSFYGPQGSTTNANSSVNGNLALFSTTEPLQPGEGLTIVVGLPPGSVTPPPLWKEILQLLKDYWPAWAFPLATLSVMWLLWWHSGRDEGGYQPVAVEWTPPRDLSPAEVGTLVDESCDMEDIVSTLVDLAVRGHLKITQEKSSSLFFFSNKDYLFTKLTPPAGEELSSHELAFLQGIFDYDLTANRTNYLSNLKAKFYLVLPTIKRCIYESLTTKGLFQANPDTVRTQYQGMAMLFLFASIWLLVSIPVWGVGTFISAVIIFLFARAMPARSAAGAKATRECLGFARFVRMAEKDRIRVLAKDDPTIFGRLLPYAMVLGAADQWASAFEGLITTPPDWYQSSDYGPNYVFSVSDFVNDLGYGMNSMRSTFASVPVSTTSGSSASSGDSGFSGGSSGGGFGGGGGGSW